MSNVELHQQAHQAMSTQSAEAAAESFADDATYTDEARGLALHGKAEITGWLSGWKTAFSDARIEDATYLDAGDWTIARFRGRGTNDGPFGDMPATGKPMDNAYCEFIRWRDGKAVEGAIYYDIASIMAQLGATPATTAS